MTGENNAYDVEHHNLYFTANNVTMNTTGNMESDGNVAARMKEIRTAQKLSSENLNELFEHVGANPLVNFIQDSMCLAEIQTGYLTANKLRLVVLSKFAEGVSHVSLVSLSFIYLLGNSEHLQNDENEAYLKQRNFH
jgi:hypothetical protein